MTLAKPQIAKPQFANIGSDAEFLFTNLEEFQTRIVPANTVIMAGKPTALQSFIGTDNHAATAEIRPGPAHNVGRHLYDIAYGLHETDKWLSTHKRFNRVKIVAQPFVCDEPLGGHIHCSFFIDNPIGPNLAKWNRKLVGGRLIPLNRDRELVPLTLLEHNEIRAAIAMAPNQIHISPELFGSWMDYLLFPYECAIQPWWDRTRRNGRYGNINGQGDKVRQYTSTPRGNKANKLQYLHYEYRIPSTWLCHPWLAYAYLGLAKLVMLNTEALQTNIDTRVLSQLAYSATPKTTELKECFMSRFSDLVKIGKWTQDIRGLVEIIPKTFDMRSAWWSVPGKPIDIDAWRRLL